MTESIGHERGEIMINPGSDEETSPFHPLLIWSELWGYHDSLINRQMSLRLALAERECSNVRAQLAKVDADLGIVIDRLQRMAIMI